MYHVPTHDHRDHRVPRAILGGVVALLAFVILVTAGARVAGLDRVAPEPADAVESVLLRFADLPEGSIVVRDEAGHEELVAPGSNGFLRGVMRGLARERRQHGIGSEQPFRLTHWSDGRLSLEDAATGRRIDLEAFGPTNAAAFARFLPSPDQRS